MVMLSMDITIINGYTIFRFPFERAQLFKNDRLTMKSAENNKNKSILFHHSAGSVHAILSTNLIGSNSFSRVQIFFYAITTSTIYSSVSFPDHTNNFIWHCTFFFCNINASLICFTKLVNTIYFNSMVFLSRRN